MKTLISIILIGVLATIFMDLWALFIKQSFGVKGLDYRILGRWIRYLLDGQYFHDPIFATPEASGEKILGWCAHYIIGITFAFVLILTFGQEWIERPSLWPALIVGVVTVVAPFFIMQPGFGIGIAGSKVDAPNILRLKSLMAHTSYGFGLYFGGLLVSSFFYR